MKRQLLRNSKVVIEFDKRAYILSALSQISGGTSLAEVSQKRKTLFSNTPKQHSTTARINPSTISLQVNVTDTRIEQLFFELAGLVVDDENCRLVLPASIKTTTKLFSMYVVNEDGSVIKSDNNFVEAIDLSMSKASILTLNISISSAGLEALKFTPAFAEGMEQGQINKPTYVDFRLAGTTVPHITSASISLQQEAEWIDTKNLFNTFGDTGEIYTHKVAATSDIILSATVQTNYIDELSEIGVVCNQDVFLKESGLSFTIENARVVSNLDIQSIYKNRLDISISEESGDAYFYFGE